MNISVTKRPGAARLLCAVGLTLASIAASAQATPPMDQPYGNPPPPMMNGEPGREPMPPFLHGIKLTDEQRDKVFDIMHAQVPTMRSREKELQQSRESLHKLALANEFDDLKAKLLAESGARIMAEIALMHARTDYQIYRLLTAEQRRQVTDRQTREARECGEPPRH
jgi:Spy/CpxP family protein refolding chaperone